MLFKNVASQKIHVYAYDSTTGAAKTGDAAQITAYVSLDGTANAIDDTNPAEVDSTNMPGIYVFDLTQAETNCNAFALYAKSSTSNIRLEPIIGFTTGAAATQTGDSYAVVTHADYGLAKLVRSTTPANTLTVDANHLVAVPATQDVNTKTITADAIDAAALKADAILEIVDALLNRDMSAVSDTNSRSPLNALRVLRNKWSISGTTLTVTKENDSTSAWTAALSTNAAAEPVTGSDPA